MKKEAKELLLIAQELIAYEEELSFTQELQMIKDMKAFRIFFKDLIKFKGSLNDFVNNLGSMVDDKNALKEFEEVIDFLKLSRFISENDLMQHARMNESEIKQKIRKVYEAA